MAYFYSTNGSLLLVHSVLVTKSRWRKKNNSSAPFSCACRMLLRCSSVFCLVSCRSHMCVCVMYALTMTTAETLMRTLSSYYEGHLGHSSRALLSVADTTPSKPIVVDDVVSFVCTQNTCAVFIRRSTTAHCAAQRSCCGWHAAWRCPCEVFSMPSGVSPQNRLLGRCVWCVSWIRDQLAVDTCRLCLL